MVKSYQKQRRWSNHLKKTEKVKVVAETKITTKKKETKAATKKVETKVASK